LSYITTLYIELQVSISDIETLTLQKINRSLIFADFVTLIYADLEKDKNHL